MKLAIVQLSDIHIKTPEDFILSRAGEIVSAIRNVAPTADAFVLAITGDVAQSGTKSQYELAITFFGSIKDGLRKTGKPVSQFVIPGNHDLDLSAQPDTRVALLQHVRKNPDTIDPHGETAKQILSVQNNFFDFEAVLLGTEPRSIGTRIAYTHIITQGDYKIRVRCFNTAWVSTNPEAPGILIFPPSLLACEEEKADIEIAVFHHPVNWLEPTNSRLFKTAVETSADLIMTGHEHETGSYKKLSPETGSTQHIEGAVLQEHGTNRSLFNVIVIDDVAGTYEVYVSRWNEDSYISTSSGESNFNRNRLARKSIFQNTTKYSLTLNDPGLPVLHPRKHEVVIDDLFVYPALACKDPMRKFLVTRVIGSQRALEFVRDTPFLVIMGEELSGKSCLAKKLYRDLQSPVSVPILLNGRNIDGFREKDVRRILRAAVEEQYGEHSVERYASLDSSQRLIIIDDWHELRYAAKGKASIIEFLMAYAGRVICLTSRLYAFEELADTGPAQKIFSEFELCDLKEFGKWATAELIQKWHVLGREDSLDLNELNFAVKASEEKVAIVIRRGILPTYPIFIVGLLQADAPSSSGAAQNAGAYGHILEMLITDRLAMLTKNPAQIGTTYTYLSYVAYFLLTKDRSYLSTKEFGQVHSEYCEAHTMRLVEEQMLTSLIKAKILCKEGDSIRFVYKGIYCYCVARYFFENIAQLAATLRPELDSMVDRIAWEDYTNIVMFYLYLSRDPQTIDRLLVNASNIYVECEPANLDLDVAFVNQLIKGTAPERLILPSTNTFVNSEEYRKRQDANDEEGKQFDAAAPDNRVPYEVGLQELVKLTISLQTLRVMGQVLRNFPGVLKGEPKYRLAEASYLLGLRTLRRILDLAQGHMQGLRLAFAEVFKEKHPLASQNEVFESADQSVIWLTGAASYGIIKRICRSVGLQDLELTFEEVREKLGALNSVKLVDLSIHLEYYKDAPKAEMKSLENDLHENAFAYKILRDLVSEFLYLRNTDNRLAQEMGEIFDIESSKPEYQMNKAVGVRSSQSRLLPGSK